MEETLYVWFSVQQYFRPENITTNSKYCRVVSAGGTPGTIFCEDVTVGQAITFAEYNGINPAGNQLFDRLASRLACQKFSMPELFKDGYDSNELEGRLLQKVYRIARQDGVSPALIRKLTAHLYELFPIGANDITLVAASDSNILFLQNFDEALFYVDRAPGNCLHTNLPSLAAVYAEVTGFTGEIIHA